tara:strand:- start:279 stop:527 length:249 start_codon:yes stop_codon:yes gene_type:complete
MDIINVAESKLRSTLDDATFELNACLEQAAVKGSLDRFSEAIQQYTYARMQLETLFKLKQQAQEASLEAASSEHEESEKNET